GADVSVGAVRVREPRLALAREADGALAVAGLRLRPPPAPPAAEGGREARAPEPAEPAPAGAFALGEFTLEGGLVRWRDDAVAPRVALELGFAANAGAFSTRGSDPVQAHATFTCHPALERLAVDAEVALAPERLTASAKVEGTGLQLAALQAYLPPSLRAEPGARVLGVELAVRADPAEAGGQALALDVRRVRLARTDAEEPELGIGSVEVRVARADPEAGVFAIDVAAVRGIQAEVVQTEDGTAIGGVCLLARAEERPPEAAPVAEAAPVEAAAPRAAV